MVDADDIHNFNRRYENALDRLTRSTVSEKSKELVRKFARDAKKKGNRLSTLIFNTDTLRHIAEGAGDLDNITEDSFDDFMEALERQKKDTVNYRRVYKKFARWLTGDELPKWVKNMRISQRETPVQPSDLLTKEELDKLLAACKYTRDKALIAVTLDSCMRIGAVGTLRIKSVEFNTCGAVLYMSVTSRNRKSTEPQPFPITWSTGYLNAWMDIHPDRNNPDAPLWTSMRYVNGEREVDALSYHAMCSMLSKVVKAAGLKKNVYFHLLKHQKVTDMLKSGFSEGQIKFQAGWSPSSNRMLKIYGNFTRGDMINSIYEKAGLVPEDKKQVTLQRCPRCRAVLVPEARVCHQCALILDTSLAGEIETHTKNSGALLAQFMSDPKNAVLLQKLLGKALSKK